MMYIEPSRRAARRGAVAAQVAVCMAGMVLVTALVLYGGVATTERRHAQSAADAAALAAAVHLYNNRTSITSTTQDPADGSGATGASMAKAVASANGYSDNAGSTHAEGSSSVTVNIPPKSGPANYQVAGTSSKGYVEVIITSYESGSLPIKARAVACYSVPTTGKANIVTLGTSGTDLSVGGNAGLSLPNGGIYVDSN